MRKLLFLIIPLVIIFVFWVANRVESSPSLNWTRLYTGTEADYFHAATMAGDGSLIRARITLPADSRKLYYQRVANPGPGSNFSTWTYANQYNCITTAVASLGAEVSIFWINSSREIRHLKSADYGATWGSSQLIDYSPTTAVYGLAAAYKPNGDLTIFWADQSTLYLKKRVAGAWQSKVSWTKTTGDLSGIAVVYDQDWNLLITGKDANGNYKLWALIYGDGERLPVGSWSNLVPIFSAPSSQYEYHQVFLDKSDVYRAFYVEEFTGTPAYSRPYFISTSANFIDLPWSTPEQFDTLSSEYGLAITHYGNFLWATAPYGVWRAAPTPCTSDGGSCSIDENCCSGNCKNNICSPIGYTCDGFEWTRLYKGFEPDYFHTAAMPGDGSLVRLRIGPPADSRKLYYQRVTNPGPGSDFSNWTYLTGQYNAIQAASCVNGNKVSQVYLRSEYLSPSVQYRESSDNGATWGSWQLIDYTPTTAVYGLAAAYKPNGDLAIFFADQSTLYVKKRVAGAWQSKVAWGKTTGNLSGVAVVYDQDWNLLITGKDTNGNYKLWALIYGDGERLPVGSWSNLVPLVSAPTSQYEYHNVFMDKSGVYRAFYVEKYTGIDSYSLPYMIETSGNFIDLPWSSPKQCDNLFLFLAYEYGLAITHHGNTLWASAPYGVWQSTPTPCQSDNTSCSLDSDCCSGNCQNNICQPIGYACDSFPWTRIYKGFEPDYFHDTAVIPADGSLVRLKITLPVDGRKLYYQRITNPGPGSDFSAWTYLGQYNVVQTASCASPQPPPQRVIGSANVSTDASSMEEHFTLNRFQADYSSTITQIKVDLAGNSLVKVAIYADQGGEPGALLNAVNEPQACGDIWCTIYFPPTTVTQGTYYWLAFLIESARMGYHTDPSAINTIRYKSAGFGGFTFPNPAGTGFSSTGGYYFLIAGWGVVSQMYNVGQVYINSSREIRFRESTNNGASWGSWQLIDYSPTTAVYGLAIAYKPNGDLAIFFADQATLYVKKRIAGNWQSKVAWNKNTGDLSGVAVIYDQDWNLLITGKDSAGNYKLWSLIYGDGGQVAAGSWSNLVPLISAPSAEYEYDRVFMDKSDIYRAFFFEKYTGIDSYSLPYMIEGSGSFPGSWSSSKQCNNLFLFLAYEYGLDLDHYGDIFWLTAPYGVWQHPGPPVVLTYPASDIQSSQAQLNGNLINMAGDSSCKVWFEWGETVSYGNSTLPQTKTVTGTFDDTITGLSPATTYHFRAVAQNVAGTTYGDDMSFTTLAPPPCQLHNVWGWAWSENIGWISMSCTNTINVGEGIDFGVDIDSDTGIFSGYAWLEHIGWISFNRADTGAPPGPPDYGTYLAQVNLDNGQVSGWARALSYGDGWDGWIKLRNTDYGAWIDASVSPSEFHDWAWGSDVVGWVSFNCAEGGETGGNICSKSDYKVVTSLSFNQPPTANICCQSCSSPNCTAYTGEVFTLINDSHDQNGDTDIVKSEWDILNWKTDPDLSCSPPNALCNFTPQFLSRGTYTVELYVEDSKGTSATDQETFTIKQSAIADFKCSLDNTNWKTCSDIKPNVGEVVYFLDQSSPPEGGSITSYSWTFQNGNPSTATGTNPSTKFQSAGQKEVTLTLGVTAGPSDPRTQTIGVELPLPEWQEVAPFGWLRKIFTIISEFFDRFI